MSRSAWWSGTALVVFALAAMGFSVQGATTVVYVEIGESVNGSIAAGVDTVEAHLNAAQGTSLKIASKAASGSTLVPTITFRDASGTTLAADTTQQIEWLPVAHVIHYYTIPASGSYVAEFGGTSGSGGFVATLTGRTSSAVELGLVSGTVTNGLTGESVPGVRVLIGPYVLVTDSNGFYSGNLPAGAYLATFEAEGFQTMILALDLQAGGQASLDAALALTTPVEVSTSLAGDGAPGGTVTATVSVAASDGSTVESVAWSQVHGAAAVLGAADTTEVTVTLGDLAAYKAELFRVLAEPPVGPDELPPNAHHDEFHAGLQDRFGVVALNPFNLEEAGLVVLEVEVTTTSGTYHGEVEIHAPLPWSPSPGLRNLPTGVPALLHGKDQVSYDWSLIAPAGSTATLLDATTQNPEFTPDVPGLYELTVTDQAAGAPVTLEIYAGTWRGVIVGQDAEGRPVSDPACTLCHSGFAPDKFSPWEQTGHAEIFTNNLNTSTHYGPNCFPCHTVGYGGAADNGGVDDAADWQGFLDSGMINNPGDNWSQVLDSYPATGQLANVQCENCHGPQSSDPGADNQAHGWNGPQGDPRVDLSADVCAVCHGEPLRHARFQQWQISPHANYELAVGRGQSGSCARCHTVNGFLKWLPVLLDDDPNTDPLASVSVDWTRDETHPQTCVTCHDPHDIGTTSGINTNATVRISGDTPPLIAGFTATDVGRGAICMTCHNSRRGPRNDDTYADYVGTSEVVRAPHGSAQADVLMGQNAYLMPVDARGSHSYVTDTCVACHMEQTAPPDALSYRSGGTNHTFYASKDICAGCHDRITASAVQGGVQRLLDEVQDTIETSWLSLMGQLIAAGNTIDFNGQVVADVGDVQEIEFGETRGRQAIGVTFNDGTVVGLTRMTDVDVVDATSAVLGPLYDFADVTLIKAGWNWNLFNNDGSVGVHNPFFVYDGLIATRNALNTPTAAAHLPEQRTLGSRYSDDIRRQLRVPRGR